MKGVVDAVLRGEHNYYRVRWYTHGLHSSVKGQRPLPGVQSRWIFRGDLKHCARTRPGDSDVYVTRAGTCMVVHRFTDGDANYVYIDGEYLYEQYTTEQTVFADRGWRIPYAQWVDNTIAGRPLHSKAAEEEEVLEEKVEEEAVEEEEEEKEEKEEEADKTVAPAGQITHAHNFHDLEFGIPEIPPDLGDMLAAGMMSSLNADLIPLLAPPSPSFLSISTFASPSSAARSSCGTVPGAPRKKARRTANPAPLKTDWKLRPGLWVEYSVGSPGWSDWKLKGPMQVCLCTACSPCCRGACLNVILSVLCLCTACSPRRRGP